MAAEQNTPTNQDPNDAKASKQPTRDEGIMSPGERLLQQEIEDLMAATTDEETLAAGDTP